MKLSRWQIGVLVATALAALTAVGCTGTDFLDTGNSQVSFEVAVEGETTGTFDCLNFEYGTIRLRPLTGTCSAGSTNPGEACLSLTDCPNGTCENSEAEELVGDSGLLFADNAVTVRGNLTGDQCEPTTADGVCTAPFFPQVACTQDSDCDVEGAAGPCRPRFPGAAAPAFVPLTSLTLSEGLYQINVLDIANIALYTDNPAFFGRCGSTFSLVDALGELRFEVGPGGDQVVRVVIDLDELEQALPGPESCAVLTPALPSVFSCDFGPPGASESCLVP